MITPRNILRHELIGLDVLVARASNPDHTGVRGLIVDETRNMLTIRTSQGVKHIPKKYSVFRLKLPDAATIEVDGSALVMQPDKRISMRIKKQR